MSFQAGDKVLCVDVETNQYLLTSGKIYTINDCHNGFVTLEEFIYVSHVYKQERFILVTPLLEILA